MWALSSLIAPHLRHIATDCICQHFIFPSVQKKYVASLQAHFLLEKKLSAIAQPMDSKFMCYAGGSMQSLFVKYAMILVGCQGA